MDFLHHVTITDKSSKLTSYTYTILLSAFCLNGLLVQSYSGLGHDPKTKPLGIVGAVFTSAVPFPSPISTVTALNPLKALTPTRKNHPLHLINFLVSPTPKGRHTATFMTVPQNHYSSNH